MTIILDENLPHGWLRVLAPRRVTTVQRAGYAGVKERSVAGSLFCAQIIQAVDQCAAASYTVISAAS